MEVRLLIAALSRRLLLILAIGIVGGLAGVTYAQADKGVYEATTQLLLDPTAIVVPGAQQFSGDPERFVGGQIGVLRSRATAERAAKAIGVSPNEVAETLAVERIVGSDVVDVIGRADTARLARDVSNAAAESYVAQRREQSAATVKAQLTALNGEIAAVQQQLAGLPANGNFDPRQQAVVSQYQQLLDRRLNLTAPGVIRDASAVLDPAQLPQRPERLSSMLAGGAGALLALLLGTALAVLLEGRRPLVTSRPQAEVILGRPLHATFAVGSRRGNHDVADRHSARVLLALVNAHPVQGRRTVAVCATGASPALNRLAASLVDIEQERGSAAVLIPSGPSSDGEAEQSPEPAGRTGPAREGYGGGLASLLMASRRSTQVNGSVGALASISADLDIAVLVLPDVLDDPSVADVAQWATDIVLLVPLGQQGESELSTAHELLTAGPARLHPVLVTKRTRARR